MATTHQVFDKYVDLLQRMGAEGKVDRLRYLGLLAYFADELQRAEAEASKPPRPQQFIAFSDEGQASYLVAEVLNAKGEVVDWTCQCGDFFYRHNHNCKHIQRAQSGSLPVKLQ